MAAVDCAVLAHVSLARCVQGESFGCVVNATRHAKVWVARRCRAWIRCGMNAVYCGSPARSRTVCSCESGRAAETFVYPLRDAQSMCVRAPLPSSAEAQPPLSCRQRDSAPPYLLGLGVLSAPANVATRTVIRSSWERFRAAGHGPRPSTVSCFVLGIASRDGREGGRLHTELASERSRHKDLLLLNLTSPSQRTNELLRTLPSSSFGYRYVHVFETGVAFWRAASRLFRRARFIGRADDDSFVLLSALEAKLHSLHCLAARGLVLGFINYASWTWRDGGHNSRMCGWSWAWTLEADRACQARGLSAIVPFAAGALQLLATPLAEWLATDRVGHAPARAYARLEVNSTPRERYLEGIGSNPWNDLAPLSALGRSPLPRTYVSLPHTKVHDLACWPTELRYPRRVPDGSSIVVHQLKRPAAHAYVQRLLLDGMAPNRAACKRSMRWDGSVTAQHARVK